MRCIQDMHCAVESFCQYMILFAVLKISISSAYLVPMHCGQVCFQFVSPDLLLYLTNPCCHLSFIIVSQDRNVNWNVCCHTYDWCQMCPLNRSVTRQSQPTPPLLEMGHVQHNQDDQPQKKLLRSYPMPWNLGVNQPPLLQAGNISYAFTVWCLYNIGQSLWTPAPTPTPTPRKKWIKRYPIALEGMRQGVCEFQVLSLFFSGLSQQYQ